MSSALYVTTKGFLKRAWLGALLAVCVLVLGPLAFRGLMSLKDLGTYGISIEPFDYHFAFLGISWIFFITLCIHALQGCGKVLLGLPVSSSTIVSGSMLITVGTVVLLYLVTNGLYRILFFDEHWLADYWPVLGPLLFLITFTLVGHAIYWSKFAPSVTSYLLMTGAIVGMLSWFISRYYPHGFQEEIVPWNHVSLSEFATLFVVSVAAWNQSTRAFSKVRSGTAAPSAQWETMLAWRERLLTRVVVEKQTILRSEGAALAQLHWRDSCRRPVMIGGVYFGITAIVLSFLVFQVSFTFGGQQNTYWNYLGIIGNVTIALMWISAFVVGFLLGDGVNNTGRTELKNYLGVAPLSDREFSAILVRNLVKTVCLTYFCFLLSCLLSHIAMVLYCGGADGSEISMIAWGSYVRYLTFHFWPFLFFSSTILWGVIATMVSVFWTGRTWFYLSLIAVFGGLCFTFIGISSFIRTESIFALLHGGLLALSLFVLVGTIAAYAIAFRKKLITAFPIVGAVLFCLAAIWFSWSLSIDDYDFIFARIMNSNYFFRSVGITSMKLFVFVLLTLLVTPFATIPLALSWNRHR